MHGNATRDATISKPQLSVDIIEELYTTVELLAGNMYILADIASFRDTLTDEQTLEAIQSWNKAYSEYQNNPPGSHFKMEVLSDT